MSDEQRDPQDNRFCVAWFAGRFAAGRDRAALLRENKWNPGDILTVSFLDGDRRLQDRVIAAAQPWFDRANLQLSVVEDPSALIRISFRHRGSWSAVGTTCLQIPRGQPTMNFGWLTPTSAQDELSRVVLHEFGHALGLVHEHQNPAGGIRWNKAAVYQDLSGPPNHWDQATIDRNIFETADKRESNYTQVDPLSIMMYPIPARWTTDGFSAGLNQTLSATDSAFIKEEYPADPSVQHDVRAAD